MWASQSYSEDSVGQLGQSTQHSTPHSAQHTVGPPRHFLA